jgi:predicted homoserine dehydrogenase-like protein
MVGAGFIGRALANQIVNAFPGLALAAIANRHVDAAARAYAEAGIATVETPATQRELERAIVERRPTVVADASLVCRAEGIDAVIEATGTIDHGARVVLEAVAHRKHVVMMSAELDGTLGPILKAYADRAGVVLSACDGDQPAAQMNLYRFVRSVGLTPLLCGNIKGLYDPYRTPTTQAEFARRWGQNPQMIASYADGTKISFEQATVANATGMTIARRGMVGRNFPAHVDGLTKVYDVEELRSLGGVVDYVVGAEPGPGVFVLATLDDPRRRRHLDLYKLGEGPLYNLYTPYHLCYFEAPFSVARAVLFHDAAIAPIAGPRVEVIAAAKTDLAAGDELDGIGGYLVYGLCERADVVAAGRLLPMGVSGGCRMKRAAARDAVLTYDDVDIPENRLHDRLRAEQAARFGLPPASA